MAKFNGKKMENIFVSRRKKFSRIDSGSNLDWALFHNSKMQTISLTEGGDKIAAFSLAHIAFVKVIDK
jgi:hypothetical protein